MTQESGLGFSQPPPVRTGKYDWETIAAKAKASPGEWFKVFDEDGHSFSVTIRSGKNGSLPPAHGFEATTRQNHFNSDGRRVCALWVRYNPDKDETQPIKKKRSR